MAKPKPLMTNSSGTDHAKSAVASALRTLEAEGSGIAAISAALQSDLGGAFAQAADLILGAKGRLIVTGLGKSGHIGRKIAATFASTGTPGVFRACRRSRPRRSRHDHPRRRHPGAVMVRRAAGNEDPDHLRQALPDRGDRDDGGTRLHPRQGRRRRADAAEGPRSLPAQPRAHHLVADDAGPGRLRWRSRYWRAAASPRSISACCIRAASSARC